MSRNLTGKRILELRKDLHWSQDDLARKLSVSKSTVSGYETGTSGIGRVSDRLARALGTTTDYLYGLSENPLPPEESELSARNPLRDAVLDEFDSLDEVDQRALYQIAVTLRLAREQRERYRVVE